MLNRTIEMKMVKKAKNQPQTDSDETTNNIFDYGFAVEGVAKVAIESTVKGVLAYKALDTICKIAINRLSK